MSVVTRFAPSPTGMLHIGGARTALFNWLFARRHGGRFLVRIEDTDRARSTPEAIEAILGGLNWLNLQADEQTTFQSHRAQRHREVAEALLARGAAFRSYETLEETENYREALGERRAALRRFRQDLAQKPPGYQLTFEDTGPLLTDDMDINEADASDPKKMLALVERLLSQGYRSPYRDGGLKPPSPDAPFVIRLRAPDAGEIVNDDLVQGRVAVRAADLDDLILVRADGSPVFTLSNVVDDHDMGVSHVIRGDDHLTNTARAIPIFRAMDWPVPAFAHLPLIHGPDGAKLSKRHGAQSIGDYQAMGYLPEGVTSYLMRLGWSPGHDDILTLAQAAPIFDLAQVGKAPARLDFEKLASVNAHMMRLADDRRLLDILIGFINAAHPDWIVDEENRARIMRALPVLKQRAKTLAELADQSFFLVRPRPYSLDGQAQKALKDDAKALLRRLLVRLETAPAWTAESLGALISTFAQDEGVGLGKFGPGLRGALTGGAAAPDLAHILFSLGRAESLARLKDQV